jgi:hypothetical protein
MLTIVERGMRTIEHRHARLNQALSEVGYIFVDTQKSTWCEFGKSELHRLTQLEVSWLHPKIVASDASDGESL